MVTSLESEKLTQKNIDKLNVSKFQILELVKMYYQLQKARIQFSNASYAAVKESVVNDTNDMPIMLQYFTNTLKNVENDILNLGENS